jgi:hypothetical protein
MKSLICSLLLVAPLSWLKAEEKISSPSVLWLAVSIKVQANLWGGGSEISPLLKDNSLQVLLEKRKGIYRSMSDEELETARLVGQLDTDGMFAFGGGSTIEDIIRRGRGEGNYSASTHRITDRFGMWLGRLSNRTVIGWFVENEYVGESGHYGGDDLRTGLKLWFRPGKTEKLPLKRPR